MAASGGIGRGALRGGACGPADAGLAQTEAEAIGFKIVIDIAPIDAAMCKVKLVDMAGESFGVRYMRGREVAIPES